MDNLNHYMNGAHILKNQRIFFHDKIKQGDSMYHDGIYWRRADADNVPIGYVAFIEAINDKYGGLSDNYYIGSIALGGMLPMRPKNQGIHSENLGTNAYDYETPIINNARYFWDYSLNKVTTAPNPKTSYFIGLGHSGRQRNVNGEFTYEGIITVPYAVINSQGNTNIINQYNTVNNFNSDTALGWKYDRGTNELYFWNPTTNKWELFNKEVYRFDNMNQFPVAGGFDKLYINDEPATNCNIPTRAWYWSKEGKMKQLDNPESVKLYDQNIAKTGVIDYYENSCEVAYAGVYTSNNVQNLGDAEINIGITYPVSIPNQIITDCNGNSILLTTTVIANPTAFVNYLNANLPGNWNNTVGQIKTTSNANVPVLGTITIGNDAIMNPVTIKTTSIQPGILTQTFSQITTLVVDVWTGAGYSSTTYGVSPLFKDDIEAVEWLNTLGIGAYYYENNKIVTRKNKDKPISIVWVKDSIQNTIISDVWTNTSSVAIYEDAVEIYSGVVNKCTEWQTATSDRATGMYIGNNTVVTEGYVGGLSLLPNTTYYFQFDGKLGTTPTNVIAGITGCDCNLNLHIRYASSGSALDLATAEMGEVIASVPFCNPNNPIVVGDNDPRLFIPYMQLMDTEVGGANPGLDLHPLAVGESNIGYAYGYTNIDSNTTILDCNSLPHTSIYYGMSMPIDSIFPPSPIPGSNYYQIIIPKTGLYSISWQVRMLIDPGTLLFNTNPYGVARGRVMVNDPIGSPVLPLYFSTIGDKRQYMLDAFLFDLASGTSWTPVPKTPTAGVDLFLQANGFIWLNAGAFIYITIDLDTDVLTPYQYYRPRLDAVFISDQFYST